MRVAVLDACVLYSAPVRDLFMYLVELFQPKWSEQIHEEWMSNLLLNRPDISLAQLERTRDLMNRHGRDCLVSHYRHLIPSIPLPDAKDRHVVAVAIASKAPTIVTFNLRDFPNEVLRNYEIESVHPDDFALSLCAASHETFLSLVARHRKALHSPSKTVTEYLAALEACGLTKTATRLCEHCDAI